MAWRSGMVLFCMVGWAGATGLPAGNDRYERADLAVINHPDLFKVFFPGAKKKREAAPVPQIPSVPAAPAPKIEFHKPLKGNPIPFDQLDSSLVQRVFFDYDKAVLKPEAKAGIQTNAAWVKQHPEYDILLEGHCDERGTSEYNLALGERRAKAVRVYMIDGGIDSARLSVRSWGKEKPLDARRTESAYALNRRVEFYAIPK